MSEKCYKCGYEFNEFSYKAKQFDENNEFLGYACINCVDGTKMRYEKDLNKEEEGIHNPIGENDDVVTVKNIINNNGYWNIHGRFGRLQYFLHWLGIIALYVVSTFIFISSGAGAVIGLGYAHSSSYAFLSLIGLIFSFVGFLTATVGNFTILIKRFHDFNQSGIIALILSFIIWIIGLIIPFIGLFLNIILLIFMVFIRGTYGSNIYGEDPTQRSI
jgi:uncharacterized membrane protein YhaH (DUF805 family)